MNDKFYRRFCIFRGYCSALGIKIAITVGIFMILPMLGYIFLHEYTTEGLDEFSAMITSPLLWGGILFFFTLVMIILSKIVILPLKKFELHMGELEKGGDPGPFELKRHDEIGYLADRFNSLHAVVKNEIYARDTQLSVLYNFTNAASGIFDIPTLMDHFFNILGTAVDFDLGIYILDQKSHFEGRIYSKFQLDDEDARGITKKFLERAGEHCPDLPKEKISRLDISAFSQEQKPLTSLPVTGIEVPLVCFGEPVGVISLLSYSGDAGRISESKVFNAMVRHTNSILERLLKHMSADEWRLNNILSSMSEGVYIIDKHNCATAINKKGMELAASFCRHGSDHAKSSCEHGFECDAPDSECEFINVINKIRNLKPEFDGAVHTEEIKNNDGMMLQISACDLKSENSEKEGYVVTAKDITEERLIQKKIMLSSKLAALGEMAAGIAHEVNNPLQVMMANIELMEPGVSEKSTRRLGQMRDGIMRIKGIVKDLLIFAREQTTEVEVVDINHIIVKVVDILQNQLKLANINIELELADSALDVRCNKNLFQQVVINLLQNAKDAIEESKKGSRVSIKTVLLPRGSVIVYISDDGPGIPENIVDRIFDPFFTTKDVGKGTGLGLSVSRRIIDGMGGHITVSSAPDTGTVFTITLPQTRAVERKEGIPAGMGHDFSCLMNKSVIVIDDEEGVVRAIKESISKRVSVIESAMDGHAAFDMIVDNDFDMILLDIKMPGMNGMELYRKIYEYKPYLAQRIIFLTGDTENESTDSFLKLTGCSYLAKPFTMNELLNVMCEYEMEPGKVEVSNR